ncbi:MAG: sugar phosphate isomerase/epimerase [Clostridia bacterium]|nr:sugar phosphate isomerase/epimerase [Clostridia bacterium]
MKKVKEYGYDGVELAGSYGLPAAQIKKVLDENGLVAISAHVPLDDMYDRPEETFSFYKTVGIPYIAVPWMGETGRPGGAQFAETLDKIRRVGEIAKKYGMQLLYHNHDFEFVKVDGKYGLDLMYETIPADLLQTELDTCWVNVGGEDPAAFVLKYSGRAPIVHLKDFFRPDGASNEGLYELIGVKNNGQFNRAFEFRCVGHGMQNMPAIVAAAEKAGAGWVIVEQDRPSQGLTPMECAYISRRYLASIGL